MLFSPLPRADHVVPLHFAMWLAARFDYRRLYRLTYPLLLASVALLAVVLVMPKINGARRWILLGPLTFQPVEIAKLALVTYLAYSLSRKAEKVKSFTVGFVPHLVVCCGMMGLLLSQPDLGSSPVASVLTEKSGDHTYALLVVTPPVQSPVAIAREAIFIIDSSGSMTGASMEQARAALLLALDDLRPGDEVVTSPFTFVATLNAILEIGAVNTPDGPRGQTTLFNSPWLSGLTPVAASGAWTGR